jgi:hypothetical protein
MVYIVLPVTQPQTVSLRFYIGCGSLPGKIVILKLITPPLMNMLSRFACFMLLASTACREEAGLPPPCTQPQFSYTLSITAADTCVSDGTVSINGGNSNYQYRLNEGPFQNAALFTGLPPGKYRLGIKSSNCIFTDTLTVPALPPGPLFIGVKNLLALHCNGCHNSSNQQAGIDFTKNCVIVQKAQRIMARAVFGNPSPMPETGLLPLGEVNKITVWFAAGAKYIN